MLAPALQRVNAHSHNTAYGISLTGNHQGAARPAGATATCNRFVEFPSLRITGCVAPGVKLDQA